jgi:hypothetical protein
LISLRLFEQQATSVWIMNKDRCVLAWTDVQANMDQSVLDERFVYWRIKIDNGLSRIVRCWYLTAEVLLNSMTNMIMSNIADHSGGAVKGMNCLRSLEPWDREFESQWRHGCLFAFILCLRCPVCR